MLRRARVHVHADAFDARGDQIDGFAIHREAKFSAGDRRNRDRIIAVRPEDVGDAVFIQLRDRLKAIMLAECEGEWSDKRPALVVIRDMAAS